MCLKEKLNEEKIMSQFNSYIPIPVECGTAINQVAFDGCNYFGTVKCRYEIIKFDLCCNSMHRYYTCREYDCICYDYSEHCFWATSRMCCNTIFKLDCGMNEIDSMNICGLDKYGIITGISYSCCNNTLIISMSCVVIEIQKDSEKFEIVYNSKGYWIKDVLSICPYILITISKNDKYYIEAINPCGEKTGEFCIENLFLPENLIFNPCIPDSGNMPIWIFALKRGIYPYLCKLDVSLEDLGINPYCCNYKICEECCCGSKPCPDCKDPCKDIMESIALVETALSHIINAEGEKIQKVIATTDNIDKIICVNREVNKTIVNATHLEQALYEKLSALCDCNICGDICICSCENKSFDDMGISEFGSAE